MYSILKQEKNGFYFVPGTAQLYITLYYMWFVGIQPSPYDLCIILITCFCLQKDQVIQHCRKLFRCLEIWNLLQIQPIRLPVCLP